MVNSTLTQLNLGSKITEQEKRRINELVDDINNMIILYKQVIKQKVKEQKC